MTAPQIQLSGTAILVLVGVPVALYAMYKASGAVGDLVDSAGEAISNAGNSLAQTVYPDSLLAPGETLGSKWDERYNQPGDNRSFLSKAWDGYWQDINAIWGNTPEPEPWGREVREPTPPFTGGASGGW